MTLSERQCMQRALVREAIGKPEAVAELFGAELHDPSVAEIETVDAASIEWRNAVEEFRDWAFIESSLA